MGYMRHHAIIVTSFNRQALLAAYAVASNIFPPKRISTPSEEVINGHSSFAVFPDGSKEGWSESDAGDGCRAALIKYLRAQAFDDGSTPLDWVEVQFGDDEKVTQICDHSDLPTPSGSRERP